MIVKILLNCLISFMLMGFAEAKEPPAFSHSTEIVIVTTDNWDSPQGTLRRFERGRPGNSWKEVGDPITVTVGKNGLGWGNGALIAPVETNSVDPLKREGDGKAPAGVFRLTRALGYAAHEQPGWKLPYVSLTPSIQCVDDEKSKFYNTLVDTSAISPDWGAHDNEKMRRSDDLYLWGILVDYNPTPAVPGGGSCIFMHIWRGPGQPTVGCTAMAQPDLESLLAWLDPDRKPLLVQMPVKQYKKMAHEWRLPRLKTQSLTMTTSTMQIGSKSFARY